MRKRMKRREFLRLSALATAGTALAACAPKVVKETVVVEKPVEKVVEKVVKETVIVEGTPQVVEKVVMVTPPPEEAVTLVFPNKWHSRSEAKYEAMDWVLSTFEAKYPYIDIESIPNPDKKAMLNKIQADCAAGDCPDLFERAMQTVWDSGWLLDLAPYIDDEWMSRLMPEPMKMNSWDGHIFGIGTEISPVPCWWNMKVLDQVGAEPPLDWEGFLALGEALKSKDMYLGTFSIGLNNHLPRNILRRLPGADEALVAEQWDNEYIRFVIDRLAEIVDGGYYPANDLELNFRTSVPIWQTHRMAVFINGAWGIQQMIDAEGIDPELKDNVVFTPMPVTGPEGSSMMMSSPGAIGLGAHLVDQPKKLDAALKFADYFTSVESAIKWADWGQSLMGVKIPEDRWQEVLDRRPLLAAFMTSWDETDYQFSASLPSRLMRGDPGHIQFNPIRDVLLSGGSKEEALEAYVAELEALQA